MDNQRIAKQLVKIAKELISKPLEDKKDLTRSELSRKLGGRKFRLKNVSFRDLARGEAVSLKVEGVPNGVMSKEMYEANKDILETLEDLKEDYSYKGMHILRG